MKLFSSLCQSLTKCFDLYTLQPSPAQPPYPQEVLDIGNREAITIGIREGQNRQADIARYKREAEAQSIEIRLPFIPQCVPRRPDLLAANAFRAHNILEDNDPRMFECLRVLVHRGRDNVTLALWHKCNVCRKFEYPCETYVARAEVH